MRLASYIHGGESSFGVVVGGGVIDVPNRTALGYRTVRQWLEAGAPSLASLSAAAPDFKLEDIEFLPTVPDSGNVICVGRNYRSHVRETGNDDPVFPRIFLKHMSSFVGHRQAIVAPKASPQFDFEGELALVIGRRGRHISEADAMDYVAGYTCLDDGSVRDYQKHSPTAGKNFVAASSMGPWMVTADEIPDPAALTLVTRLNGEEMQRSSVDKLIFSISYLISYISTWAELAPGDVIATGTPSGVGSKRVPPTWLRPGDALEIEISNIGVLANSVIAE